MREGHLEKAQDQLLPGELALGEPEEFLPITRPSVKGAVKRRGQMREHLREFNKYRGLFWMITYRDIKVRYKQSVMGFLWAILMPVLIVMSGLVVRFAYAFASHAPINKAIIASVAVKSLPWAFLVSSIRFSCNSLMGNKELVTSFPVTRAGLLAGSIGIPVAPREACERTAMEGAGQRGCTTNRELTSLLYKTEQSRSFFG